MTPGFLKIHIWHDQDEPLWPSKLSVSLNTDPIGEGDSQSWTFRNIWHCQAIQASQFEDFELRPEKFLAFGNRYLALSSGSGDRLATIRDHKWDFTGMREVSVESTLGPFTISERSKSIFSSVIDIGQTRFLDIHGAISVHIACRRFFGNREYDLTIGDMPTDLARATAVLTASVIVLDRALSHRG